MRSIFLFLSAMITVIALTSGGPVNAQAPVMELTLTGQSMIRSDIRAHAPGAVPVITSLLKGDVIFTNFEATVLDVKKGQSPKDGRFLSPPEAMDALKSFGFNVISLANNHAFDLKTFGIENALAEANKLNLVHAGTGKNIAEAAAPAYLRTPKGTVALIAIASGLVAEGGSATPNRPGVNELRVQNNRPNPEDAQRILQNIREARQRADLVIVYEHNHVFDKPFNTILLEELPERLAPPAWLKQWTHDEVDAGADVIVMHGAPLLHGVEIYRDRPIEGQPDVHDEHTNNLFLQTRGLPRPATGEQAQYILERLANMSRPFGTRMQLKGDTAEIELNAK